MHWNFFITLSFVGIFSTLFDFHKKSYWIFGSFFMFVYEFCLEKLELREYILNSPRDNFILMNREGIFGCLGN